mmetsp:Transcript_4381/g.7698  ORF Transcript_4381/g.7698 Transcript_4381/m.7698 type:complete len:82 (+) Transcript_4381:437-682(+)
MPQIHCCHMASNKAGQGNGCTNSLVPFQGAIVAMKVHEMLTFSTNKMVKHFQERQAANPKRNSKPVPWPQCPPSADTRLVQ